MIDSPDFLYGKSPKKWQALFPDLPEALGKHSQIPKDATSKLPWEMAYAAISSSDNLTAKDYLKQLITEGSNSATRSFQRNLGPGQLRA